MRTVSIQGQRYLLHEQADIDRLRREVIAAVHAGAAIVDFPLASGTTVGALVTPAIAVVFETRSSTRTRSAAETDDPDADMLHAFNYDDMDW